MSLNNDATWSQVVSVKAEDTPLTAYNLTVSDFHTYFVSGSNASNLDAASVWVHNNCFDDLKDHLQGMQRAEFDQLTARWGPGERGNLADNLIYHAREHWGSDLPAYLRSASQFTTRGARSSGLRHDGSILYQKNGFFAVFRDGKMVTYGKN